MEPTIEIQALPHPDDRVRRLGFDLTHPYVEQCWGAILGPSGVTVLRRMPTLWREREPARMPSAELAATFGLTGGTGEHGKFNRTLNRLVQFRLAHWVDDGAVLGVFTEIAPLTEHALSRVPSWTKTTHQHLLAEHLDGIATQNGHRASVADISARLDRLQQPDRHQLPSTEALGR
jgi:hypothetical protein